MTAPERVQRQAELRRLKTALDEAITAGDVSRTIDLYQELADMSPESAEFFATQFERRSR